MFVWNTYSDWSVSRIASTVLAIVPAIRLFRAGTTKLKEGPMVALATFMALLLGWQGLVIFVVNTEVVSEVRAMLPGIIGFTIASVISRVRFLLGVPMQRGIGHAG